MFNAIWISLYMLRRLGMWSGNADLSTFNQADGNLQTSASTKMDQTFEKPPVIKFVPHESFNLLTVLLLERRKYCWSHLV